MSNFAFFCHPKNLSQVRKLWPQINFLPGFLAGKYLKTQHLKVINLNKVKSVTGKEIQGHLIVWPILPKDIIRLTDEDIFEKIVEATRIAEDLKVLITGLDGFIALTADKKPLIYKHLKRTALTNGSALLAWTIFESLFRVAKQNKLDLTKVNVTVIDPAGAVGWLCARKFCEYGSSLILTGANKEILQKMENVLINSHSRKIVLEQDISLAVREADIVINCSRFIDSGIIAVDDIKEKAIVTDASVFKNISAILDDRKDIFTVDAGLIKLPCSSDISQILNYPERIIPAAMAETILLALEEKFVNYSLGENLSLAKMEDISNMSILNGFEVYLNDGIA